MKAIETTVDAGVSDAPSRLPVWLSAALVALFVVTYALFPAFREWLSHAWAVLSSADREQISTWVSQFGIWGPLALIAAMMMQMFLVVVPSALLMAVAVLAFGAWWGTLLAVVAVLAASMFGYLLGRWLGSARIGRVLGEDTLARTQWFVEHYGAWMVVLVRLSPFLSNDAISLVAGVLRMDAMRFTLATMVGIVPLAVAIGYVGQHTETMATAFAWVSGVSLAILAGVVWLDRKRRAD